MCSDGYQVAWRVGCHAASVIRGTSGTDVSGNVSLTRVNY